MSTPLSLARAKLGAAQADLRYWARRASNSKFGPTKKQLEMVEHNRKLVAEFRKLVESLSE